MSALIDRAIRAAGLEEVRAARLAGDLARVRALVTDRRPDLLVLGALADRIRAEEVGSEVRVYTGRADESPEVVTVPAAGDVLREVALARIIGPLRARVRVDWIAIGLELAQVALGFGANELVGTIVNRRGLPIAEGQMSGTGKKSTLLPTSLVKKREIAGFIERSGRVAVFVEGAQALEVVGDSHA